MKPALLNYLSEAQLLAWHDHDHLTSLDKCGILTDAARHQSKHVDRSSPYVFHPHFLYKSHSLSTGCLTSLGLATSPSSSSSLLNCAQYRYSCFLFAPSCRLCVTAYTRSQDAAVAYGVCVDYTSSYSPHHDTLPLPFSFPFLRRVLPFSINSRSCCNSGH